jgi:hypothetical protein
MIKNYLRLQFLSKQCQVDRHGREFRNIKIIIFLLVVGVVIMGCNHKGKKQKTSSTSRKKIDVLQGKKLAMQYCSSCHLPVTAKYLDKKTWVNSVLSIMANKMEIGVFDTRNNPKKNSMVPFSKWLKIVTYFKNEAPNKLTVPKDNITLLDSTSAMFTVEKPRWKMKPNNIATTTLVKYDSLNHKLYTSNASSKKMYSWNRTMKPTFIPQLHIKGVNAYFYKDSLDNNHGVFTGIGELKQVNAANGKVIDFDFKNHTKRIIAKKLLRPVFAVPGDFNKDGLKDWVIGAFGHTIGGLYLYTQQPDPTFRKKVIRNIPGAIDAHVGDFNHDGWPDVMVLFAQAKEGIWLFTNNRRGGFKQRSLLRFPPVYGSNSFQLMDFNHDGKLDILYVAGDNGDFTPVLKPYHGIYIFINQGNYHYKKIYFHHINGATKAIAADFDNDGDLDIAVIAYYADLKEISHQSFIYFEQDKPMHFVPSTPAPLDKLGRWICMDVADIDGDEDLDIILGNFPSTRGFTTKRKMKTKWDARLPIIILKNKARH